MAGLEQSVFPTWVIDAEQVSFVWVNEAAVELWRAPDRAALLARDIFSSAPNKVIERTRHLAARARAGEVFTIEWTFYPHGAPVPTTLHLRGITCADGRLGLLNQAHVLSPDSDPVRQRSVAMLHHTATVSAFVDAKGALLAQNQAAATDFDQTKSWLSWFCDPKQGAAILSAALAGDTARSRAQVQTLSGPRWHEIDANSLRDPVSGVLGVLVEHRDETERLAAERVADARAQHIDKLSATLELVERQRHEILALSAPILDVGDATLAVPIIGALGPEQAAILMTKLLDAVSSRGVRRVILDLTGVTTIDAGSTTRLLELVRALRLLGAMPSLTGIRPELARAFTDARLDFGDVPTLRSLAAGLRQRQA